MRLFCTCSTWSRLQTASDIFFCFTRIQYLPLLLCFAEYILFTLVKTYRRRLSEWFTLGLVLMAWWFAIHCCLLLLPTTVFFAASSAAAPSMRVLLCLPFSHSSRLKTSSRAKGLQYLRMYTSPNPCHRQMVNNTDGAHHQGSIAAAAAALIFQHLFWGHEMSHNIYSGNMTPTLQDVIYFRIIRV